MSIKASMMRAPGIPCVCWCGCGHDHVKAISEAELAAKPHQWSGVTRIERKFFSDTMVHITEMEEEILGALHLPRIEKVREYVIDPDEPSGRRWTGLTREMELDLEQAVYKFLGVMLGPAWGRKDAIRKESTAIYEFYQLLALQYGVDKTAQILRSAKDRPSVITAIVADPNMTRFRAMQQAAGTRIRTELAQKNLPEVVRDLEGMAQSGEWPIRVAARLHESIGEGKAWYWRRITRTESALANNLAFDMMSQENGVLYEQWMAGPDACVICQTFDGRIWRIGEGPEPVVDSHPHCGCVRIGLYNGGTNIQDRWTRASIFDEPYTREELQALDERLRSGRGVRYMDLAQ